MHIKQKNSILVLATGLLVLLFLCSFKGWYSPKFYILETPNWQAQSRGQDLVDLFLIVPCLLLCILFYAFGKKQALYLLNGILLYIVYTFLLFCFDVHFNSSFLMYCAILSLSFYILLLNLYQMRKYLHQGRIQSSVWSLATGIYFILISVLFTVLWLKEIIPAIIKGSAPQSVVEAGLFTNGVQVLDLAFVLPAIFISGVFLLKGHTFASILTPLFLSFFILMDITIAVLNLYMQYEGLISNTSIAVVMGVLTIISLIFLIGFTRSNYIQKIT